MKQDYAVEHASLMGI